MIYSIVIAAVVLSLAQDSPGPGSQMGDGVRDSDHVEMPAEENTSRIPTYADVGGWHIVKSPDGCSAVLVVQREGEPVNYLMFYYRPAKALVEISFSSQHSSSLAAGDSRLLDIYFFDGNRQIDGRYNRVRFTVLEDGEGARTFKSDPGLKANIFTNVMKGSEVAFFYQSRIITLYPLFSTTKMVPVLKKCAFEVTGLDPRDPFIQ